MSFQITEAFVKQFSSNVFHLSQQKGSRLRMAVRNESQVGKSAFYDRIGQVEAQLRTTRHGDTPRMDTPHDRRRVDLFDYEWADLIDDQDKIRMLMDPTSMYAQAAAWSLGRAMDRRIIRALGGTAVTQEDENGQASLEVIDGTSQKFVVTDGTSDTLRQLTVRALRKIKKKLDEQEVDPSIKRYMVVNASMLESLLAFEETTSSDYNSIKALVQGDINTFMGFEFIRTELLPTADEAELYITEAGANDVGRGYADDGEISDADASKIPGSARVGFAWAQDGCLLATGQDITGEIARRADKSFATQVYAKMSIGAVRMEEAKVVKFFSAD
jgi:hypothetical protein